MSNTKSEPNLHPVGGTESTRDIRDPVVRPSFFLASTESVKFNFADLIPLTYQIMFRHLHVGPDVIRAFQNRQLRRLVNYAYRKTPFYRRHFDQAGLKPSDIKTVDDLVKIPFTTRQDLQDHGRDMVSVDYRPGRLPTFSTSGSSGSPITVRMSTEEHFIKLLFRLRCLRYWGAKLSDRHVNLHLSGRKRTWAFEMSRKIVHSLGLAVNTIVDCRLPAQEIASALRRASPNILIGYARAIHHLAVYLMEQGGPELRLRLVMTGAEELSDDMRQDISQAFQAPVYNYYGSWEMGTMAWECRHTGLLHTNDDGVVLEIVKDGRPARPGEEGQVIGTNLACLAMPRIRYQQGDLVIKGPDRCSCGLPFGSISRIRGRLDDVFILPSGRVVNYYGVLQFLDYEVRLIRQFQLIQEERGRFHLKIVPRREVSLESLEGVRQRALERLGEKVEFTMALVDRIPPEPSGKYKRVISRVAR